MFDRANCEYLKRYFDYNLEKTPNYYDIRIIGQAIEEQGYWYEAEEWRFIPLLEKTIEKIHVNRHVRYKVTVEFDCKFTCQCPTLERAVEFLYYYETLIKDLVYTLGRPSRLPNFKT